ncbi:hypothetical protein [Devosia nitrariae]|uniref:Uncharacterized protein n=1 Tax=Devosia nitrariae TaxID=2071872 RepID=A0ABQ5W168_9HYPH|nr:hypothetical protein [Devosia nitrariae]GLQ53583.1 hypothetical protein GCM10010862_08420 [Devosia nitrariae]
MIEFIAIAGAVVPLALGLLATPVGLPILSWLVGNPVGRVVAMVGVSIALLAVVFIVGRRSGENSKNLDDVSNSLEALRDRIAVDEEIRAMPPDRRREELSRWVRR